MKVFISKSEQTSKNPRVLAVYSDATEIADDAHGKDAIMLRLPGNALVAKIDPVTGVPLPSTLADRWQEAKPTGDVAVLHELLNTVIDYGHDVTKWPPEARALKVKIDKSLGRK